MKYFLVFFLSIFSLSVFAQEVVVPDERLYEVYEKDYVDGLVNDNPFLIKRWNFYLDNSYRIIKDVEGKQVDYPSIEIENTENINILLLEKELNIRKNWDTPMIYKIKGTDKLLVYQSGKAFSDSLKKHLEIQ